MVYETTEAPQEKYQGVCQSLAGRAAAGGLELSRTIRTWRHRWSGGGGTGHYGGGAVLAALGVYAGRRLGHPGYH
jgi:hypothetical protein